MLDARPTQRTYWRAAAAAGLAFVSLVLAVGIGWLRPVDFGVAAAAKAASPCWIRNASEAASVLLAGELSLIYAGLLGIWCAWRGQPLVGLAVVAALLATVAVEFSLKYALYQPSPGYLLTNVDAPDCLRVGYPFASVSETVVPNTLPSGYATRASYFGVLIAQLCVARWGARARWVWLALGVTLAILAASRVAIVWHWPSDVVAGLLLGAALALVVLALADGFRWASAPILQPSRYRSPSVRR